MPQVKSLEVAQVEQTMQLLVLVQVAALCLMMVYEAEGAQEKGEAVQQGVVEKAQLQVGVKIPQRIVLKV